MRTRSFVSFSRRFSIARNEISFLLPLAVFLFYPFYCRDEYFLSMAEKQRTDIHTSYSRLESPAPNTQEQPRPLDHPLRRSLSFQDQDTDKFGEPRNTQRRASSPDGDVSSRSTSPIVLRNLPSAATEHYEAVDQKRNNLGHPNGAGWRKHVQPRQPHPRNLFGGLRKSMSYPWLLEILSSCLAVVALMAIIVTLAVHNKRPLPQWPHAISINALIAVFTAIFKGCLLMPVAEGRCIFNIACDTNAYDLSISYKSAKVAVVPPISTPRRFRSIRLCQPGRMGLRTAFASSS